MKSLFVFLALTISATSFAKCFTFEDQGPARVGPVDFAGYHADKICVVRVNAFGGRKYYSVRFSDSQGDIAQLASQTELVGRCPGFCRTYTLTSGNALGQNVNPDGVVVSFQAEPNWPAKLTLTYKDSKAEFFVVEQQ